MTDLSVLSSTCEPWVLKTLGSCDDLIGQIESHLPDGAHIVILEASAMRSREEFYNELIAKLKLPGYFGRNLNALDECVTDLEWLGEQPLVLIVRDAEVMLRNDHELLEGFVEVMRYAGEAWGKAVAEGSEWDRPAVPFHLVFNYAESEAFKAHALPRLDTLGKNR